MSRIYRGVCVCHTVNGLHDFATWANEIHFWGLRTHEQACMDDIKHSMRATGVRTSDIGASGPSMRAVDSTVTVKDEIPQSKQECSLKIRKAATKGHHQPSAERSARQHPPKQFPPDQLHRPDATSRWRFTGGTPERGTDLAQR
jgi:hypothetical protein